MALDGQKMGQTDEWKQRRHQNYIPSYTENNACAQYYKPHAQDLFKCM